MPTLYPGQNNLTGKGYTHAVITHVPGPAKTAALGLLREIHRVEEGGTAQGLAAIQVQVNTLDTRERENLSWVIQELEQGRV